MPYTQSCKTCEGCIWYDQCGTDMICDDYSPVDDNEEDTYNADLKLRCGVYQETIGEYSDGTPLSDAW